MMKRGIIEPSQTVTIKTLVDLGLAKKVKYGLKVLGKGLDSLTTPINLEVTDASASVITKIKQLGGYVKCIYRTKKTLAAHLRPQHYPLPMETPMPIVRKVEQLDRIAARGAQVQYVKPKWKLEMVPVEPPKFEYPVRRVPGMGATKVRTRKPKLYREVSYNLP